MENNQIQGETSLKQAHGHQVAVVMVPFPVQSHLNQLLHLSRIISSYNIPIHYITSTTHNRQVKTRIHGWNPNGDEKIYFHDFELPKYNCPPPNPNAKIKFPSHLQPLFDASISLREPVTKLVTTLSSNTKRVIVVYDSLMASAVIEVCLLSNVETYTFHSVSAFFTYCFGREAAGEPLDCQVPKDLPSDESCSTPEFFKFAGFQYECAKLNSGNLLNTSELIEPSFLDLLRQETTSGSNKVWAIAPLSPISITGATYKHKCLQWLDKQEKNSVIYVSFGTTTTLNDDEIKDLAIGLEQSKQKFLWVLRDADKGDIFEGSDSRRVELPKGYEERVKDRGFILRDWAPQLEILGHESTGGFMSHCGWNSCMESLTMGVPIAAWPMHSDQPKNTVLITKVLKLGVAVKDWAKRDELVTSNIIENSVRKLMASEEGDCIRKRTIELSGTIKRSMEDKPLELDSFIVHITRQLS